MNSLRFYAVLLVIFPIHGIQSILYTTAKNNTYYIEDTYLFTWYDAHLECSIRDMALLNIDSKEKYDDIYELLLSGKFNDKPPHLWVGAIGINKKFAWTITGKPIIPSLWCNICPNNHPNNENCVEFWGNQHGLNDLNCDSKIGFVCEDRVKKVDKCEEKKPSFVLNIMQHN
ncbi:lectin subunit alpha-like [Calliphora vicina]|uniref:lectin subunit alpha-like n=1 Tax=Calliphora vicina TaxID=7373 RepID=UPI00325B3978